MRSLALALLASLAFAPTGCGGSTTAESPTGHADGGSASDGPQPGTAVGACGSGRSCPAGSTCYFPIGSCTATGQCIENAAPGTPECGALELVCGCGTMETTGCAYPSGYASGPATGPGGCEGMVASSTTSSASTTGLTSTATTAPSATATSSTTSSTGGILETSSVPSTRSSTTMTSVTSQSSSSAETTCPAAAPTVGSACQVPFDCEYGTDPDVACDTVFSCTGGAWVVATSPGPTGCGTTNPASCPASYSALQAEGGMCPIAMSGTTCEYPQARCSCGQSCGMVGVGDGAIWCCPDAAPGGSSTCPSPRPRLGTACDASSTITCDYGGCSGNVDESCTDGAWQKQTMFGCPG